MTLAPWQHEGQDYAPSQEDLEKLTGFVYIVREKSTGKMYIGMRNFWSYRKPSGKKKRRVKAESDWRRYATSSAYVSKAMRAAPGDWERTILHLCKLKGEMSYLEAAEMFARNAVFSPDYLNENICGRFFRKNVEKYFQP